MLAVEHLEFSSFDDQEIAALFAPLKMLRSLAVGVSGGPDSMALMLMLVAWRARIGESGPDIHVLSVDHGLRRTSAEEVEFVARISRQYGLAHTSFRWDGAHCQGNISAKSRKARYDLMCDWCEQQQISHLLVAHTLDDQAETVLLRLARGSGVDGISAMAVSRVWNTTTIFRPLLGVKRSRLLQLLDCVQCPFVSDPSNQNLKYDRVKIRQALKILEPLGITAEGLAETAGRLGQAREALEALTCQALGEAVSVHEAGYCILSPQQLALYPYEIKRRVLARVLRAVAGHIYAPAHASLDGLLTWLLADETSNRTLGGCLLMPRHREIWVMRETGRNDLPEMTVNPGESLVWDNRFQVSLSAGSESPLLIKALGVETYARLRGGRGSSRHYPSALGAGLPSFWHNQELIAVPQLNFRAADSVYQIEAVFANSAQLAKGQRA